MHVRQMTSLAILLALGTWTEESYGIDRIAAPGGIPSTTTTTVAPGGTTTTTLPTGQLVAGKKLLLKDDAAKPDKRRLLLLMKDSGVDLGGGNGSADDPTIFGGELRVVSRTGDGFVAVYPLPADAWRYKGKAGKNKGYKFKGTGPIRKILIKANKLAKVTGKGAGLLHTLGADPDPVHVTLSIGAHRYCATFGGDPKFTPGKKYLAKKTTAPGACLALVPECGDGILEANEICPLLEGPGDMPAVDVTSNYDGEPGVPDTEIEEEAPGVRVARTRVDLEFAPTVTVADVNAVLDALGGEILMMVSGAPLLVVRIADPGSVGALETAIAAAATSNVRLSKAHFAEDDELPPNYDASGNANLSFIDSLISVGAPAAWNAREGAGAGPLLVVADSFGDGPPTNDVSAVPLVSSDFAMGNLKEHGYHVLGIAAGDFEGTGFCENGVSPAPAILRGCVTGMNPIPVPVRVVDLRKNVANLGTRMRIVLATVGTGNVVVNTSLNECCAGTCGDLDASGKAAREWALLVRGFGLEGRMLHLTSAGNIDNDPMLCKDGAVVDAVTNSGYAAAALHPSIPDLAGTGTIPNLTNTLVVENVVNAGSIPFAPLCLNASSKRPGSISAIGTTILSHTDAGTNANQKTGTSMSTPQVAGLAAYLWSLDPTMPLAKLKALLQLTTVPVAVGASGGTCAPAGVTPTPMIDAYAAVLGTDRNLMTAPARRAILDVVDAAGALGPNGRFDERDLERFLSELDNAAGARDWSRFDLNGDGRTGGMTTARFDLDVDDPPAWSMVARPDGLGNPYDETAVTDLDVLCYYANSPLYVGSREDRAALLMGRPCPVLMLSASLASSITPGTPETLVVSVSEQDDMGSRPRQGIYVELTPTGGTVAPANATTDAQGEITAQVSVDATATAVEVLIRALTGPGGTEIGRTEVVALSTMPPLDPQCSVYLEVGVNPAQTNQLGPLMGTSTDGPVMVTGSIAMGHTELEVHYDVANQPWIYEGGAEAVWNDIIEIRPINPSDGVSKMRHRMRFTVTSNVNNRTKPENSQGWFELDSDGFQRGGTFGFNERNLGGDRPERVQETVYERSASARTELRVRTRLSTFTGFGGETIDAQVDGTAVVEWLGIEEVLDFDGTPIPFTYRSLCGGLVGTTTSTSTSTSTSTTTSTSSSTTTTSTPSSTTPPTATSTTSTSTSTTSTTTAGGGASYRLYDATGQDAPTVMLEDQIRTESVDLGSVVHLLVPVSIDGSPVIEADAYETCWAYPGATFTGTAQVSNVFGSQTLAVGDPAAVCSPESVTLVALDDFACYGATGSTVGQIVFLDDGLTAESVTVGDPRFLCLPTRVDGDPLVTAAGALVCYDTPTSGSAPGSIAVDNRFGTDTLGVGLPAGVCLPSTVTSVVPGP